MEKKKEFDELCVNIRAAFRLLFEFVKSMNSIVNFIGEKLNLVYLSDKHMWGVPPQNDSKNMKNKGIWDWFSFYYYGWDFKKEKPAYSFSIILLCDTGCWDSFDDDTWDEEKIINYGDVKNSKTKIIFGICKKKDINITKKFDEHLWAEMVTKGKKDIENMFTIPVSTKSDNKIFFKVFELSDFIDQKTAEKSLDTFVAYLKKNDINDFEIKKKEGAE